MRECTDENEAQRKKKTIDSQEAELEAEHAEMNTPEKIDTDMQRARRWEEWSTLDSLGLMQGYPAMMSKRGKSDEQLAEFSA